MVAWRDKLGSHQAIDETGRDCKGVRADGEGDGEEERTDPWGTRMPTGQPAKRLRSKDQESADRDLGPWRSEPMGSA